MKNVSPVAFLLSGTLLFFYASPLRPQQNPLPAPELLRQYQSDPSSSASSERMQQLLSEYQKHKAGAQETTREIDAEKKENPVQNRPLFSATGDGGSLYENILRGVTTHPDLLLAQLSVFGYDVFSQAKPSTFAPSDYFSVPADYPINSGDEIVVMLWGRINEESRLRVSRNGTINIPRIGPVSVAGLPFESVQKNILDRVGNIEGVHASVSMGQLRSIGIYIVGEVTVPGFYTISSLSNVTNALFAAGGPTKRGSLRNIQLKRNGRLVAAIDYYDFLLSGSDRSGLRLQSGDVIYVPIIQSMAAIAGNVRRSALYELKGTTSLSELVRLAGGVSPAGWINRMQVERFQNNQFQSVLDIASENNNKIPSFEIEDGDIVKIFPILEKDKYAVYLSGNVLRPGKYEFKQGMRIGNLIPDYLALLPETYFNYGILLRQNPETFIHTLFPFNVKKVLDEPLSADNLALRPKDEVVIYNKDYFEPDRTVSIEGAVNKPGSFKLLEKMTIRDLVLQAGGLRIDASPIRGELYRRNVDSGHVEINKVEFCVECVMKDDTDHNYPLMRSDRIFIRQKKDWEDIRKVSLGGQIAYPGTYVILEGETLGELVKRAGGFKSDAYLAASVYTRPSVRAIEEQRNLDYLKQLDVDILSLSSELTAKEKAGEAQAVLNQMLLLKEKLKLTSPVGRIILDLTRPEFYEGFKLENGDELFVPRNTNTVMVFGEVYNPATFAFNNKHVSPWYYVESAGGLKESSDKKHVYIIKANGRVITRKMQRISSVRLAPGDAVVVSPRLKSSNAYKLFLDTVEVIYKIAVSTALVWTLIK
ncbi:MAG: SLBB domain-containing protein [Chitinispirillaceae bacterium]|nr:SLBB domain-containing protein [Chitinispirillaceae bacterium]